MSEHPQFDHVAFRAALERLGLNGTTAGHMLGVSSTHVRRMRQDDGQTEQARPVKPTTARLLQAYLDGYRPKDWPV